MKDLISKYKMPVIYICDLLPIALCACLYRLGVWSWFILLALQITLAVCTYQSAKKMGQYILSYLILFLSTVGGQYLSMVLYLDHVSSDAKSFFIGGYGVLAGGVTVLLLGTVPGWFFYRKTKK